MDKELYFEMLEKKDEEIQDLKGDIYILQQELEESKKDNIEYLVRLMRIRNIVGIED